MSAVKSSKRIDVADVLRSVAILGIVLLHCTEHYRFTGGIDYQSKSAFLNFLDGTTWNAVHFVFSSKSYAIFSVLFGFSFLVQFENQRAKGKDFSLRFLWRMVLLFGFGLIHSLFYAADILAIYAIIGLILPLVVRLKDKALVIISAILVLQPQMIYFIYSSFVDGSYVVPSLTAGSSFISDLDVLQRGSNFVDTALCTLKGGELNMFQWSFDTGRLALTLAYFIMGIIIARRSLFLRKNLKFWHKALIVASGVYLLSSGLNTLVPSYITNTQTLSIVTTYLSHWINLSLALALTALIIMAFYQTKLQHSLMKLVPFGKMSLTNYLTQSIIGSAIFFGWGLGWAFELGYTFSFLVGFAIFVVQLYFSRWWLSSHKQGPLEWLWKRLTWIFAKK